MGAGSLYQPCGVSHRYSSLVLRREEAPWQKLISSQSVFVSPAAKVGWDGYEISVGEEG